MKKSLGIILAFIFACTVQVSAKIEYTIDGNRLDFKYKHLGEDNVKSVKLSSIVLTRKKQFENNDPVYIIFIETDRANPEKHEVNKDIYNKILDYMEDSK